MREWAHHAAVLLAIHISSEPLSVNFGCADNHGVGSDHLRVRHCLSSDGFRTLCGGPKRQKVVEAIVALSRGWIWW